MRGSALRAGRRSRASGPEISARGARPAGVLAALLLITALCPTATALPEEAARERPPAVAGTFYPGERAELEAAIDAAMAAASAPRGPRPVALVAPHAGYVFCGGILGEAWRQARGHDYDLIVILGTNHTRADLSGVSVWTGGAWRTPLGAAAVDTRAAKALVAADRADCTEDPLPHGREHSIEVQVPFAERLFPGVPILPAVVATTDLARLDRFARALAGVVRGRRALVIASSDLSHYPPRAEAAAVDRAVLAAIAGLDPAAVKKTIAAEMRRQVPGLATCACGEAPILAAMAVARALGATRGAVIRYANSGDVPFGDPGAVVGYGAVAFTKGAPASSETPAPASGAISPADRRHLLAVARAAIAGRLGAPPLAFETCGPRGVMVERGAFVTLKMGGELRGCTGHLAADTPLCTVVWEMAVAAAFHDSRFPPLGRDELPAIEIEISVLTPARPVAEPGDIVVGRDGVILEMNGRSAVFLPQVASEQGWDRATMLSHLAAKAGLPPDAWREGATFRTFEADVFGEGAGR